MGKWQEKEKEMNDQDHDGDNDEYDAKDCGILQSKL